MIVILGAGLAGLSTAYHLRRGGCRHTALVERQARPGGLCRSESRDGYTFDYTGHFLHLNDPAIKRLATRWLGRDLPRVVRNSCIFSHGVYTPYPFQTHTCGLPVEVRKDVILGYVQARYEPADIPREPADDQGLPEPARSFERWIHEGSGAGIARHFMLPYNDKLYGVHPRFLTTEWMGRFMPPTPLEKVVEGALTDQTTSVGYNATYRYPRRGGIEALVRALARRVGPIRLGCEAVAIDPRKHTVGLADGTSADYEALVSTLPLPELVARLRGAPTSIVEAAGRLRCSSMFAVNLGLRVDRTEGRQWVYVPERRFGFHRVGCFSNAAASMAPPGGAAVWVEFTHNAHRPIDRKAARRQAIEGLKAMGWLRSRRDIAVEWLLDMPHAYVTFDAHHRRATRAIHRYLERHDIHATGRYGRWEYSAMEDALRHGRDTAQRLLGTGQKPD